MQRATTDDAHCTCSAGAVVHHMPADGVKTVGSRVTPVTKGGTADNQAPAAR
eukprot:m.28123 g.28123  ORF g.28123 m.28123 type:complete len:52 (+) comp4891_c0_seq1:1219-1374(+)